MSTLCFCPAFVTAREVQPYSDFVPSSSSTTSSVPPTAVGAFSPHGESPRLIASGSPNVESPAQDRELWKSPRRFHCTRYAPYGVPATIAVPVQHLSVGSEAGEGCSACRTSDTMRVQRSLVILLEAFTRHNPQAEKHVDSSPRHSARSSMFAPLSSLPHYEDSAIYEGLCRCASTLRINGVEPQMDILKDVSIDEGSIPTAHGATLVPCTTTLGRCLVQLHVERSAKPAGVASSVALQRSKRRRRVDRTHAHKRGREAEDSTQWVDVRVENWMPCWLRVVVGQCGDSEFERAMEHQHVQQLMESMLSIASALTPQLLVSMSADPLAWSVACFTGTVKKRIERAAQSLASLSNCPYCSALLRAPRIAQLPAVSRALRATCCVAALAKLRCASVQFQLGLSRGPLEHVVSLVNRMLRDAGPLFESGTADALLGKPLGVPVLRETPYWAVVQCVDLQRVVELVSECSADVLSHLGSRKAQTEDLMFPLASAVLDAALKGPQCTALSPFVLLKLHSTPSAGPTVAREVTPVRFVRLRECGIARQRFCISSHVDDTAGSRSSQIGLEILAWNAVRDEGNVVAMGTSFSKRATKGGTTLFGENSIRIVSAPLEDRSGASL